MDIKQEINKIAKTLSVPEQHQKTIAIKTLKMNDVMARMMGGMSKEEARKFLKGIGYTDQKIKDIEKGKSAASTKAVELRPLPKNNFMPGIPLDYMVYFKGKPWGKLYWNTKGYVADKGIPAWSEDRQGNVVGHSIGEKGLSAWNSLIAKINKEWAQWK